MGRLYRSLRRQVAIIDRNVRIEIDPLDIMLDLDPGMVDPRWRDEDLRP